MVKFFKKRRVILISLFSILGLWGILNAGLTGISFSTNKSWMSAQGAPLFYFPKFPTRLVYLVAEITAISEKLVTSNEEWSNFINTFDCRYAQSQCVQTTKELPGGGRQSTCEPGPIKVFGRISPTPGPMGNFDETEATPEEKRSAINDLNIKLASLEETLKGEIEIGLEKQLKTLRPEDAQLIRENLDKLNRLIPEMRSLAEKSASLPDDCSARRCTPECELGQTFTAEACIGVVSQQKPTELKFKVGVGLNDLNLGRVGVENINLSLPNKIIVPTPQLPSLNFRVPNVTLTCPTQRQQIVFRPPTPTLPKSPTLTLSCPTYPRYSSYQCSSPPSQGEEGFLEFEWWNQTFEHLSGECIKVVQKAAEITGQLNSERGREEYQRLIAGCLSPEQTAQTTVNECEKRWVERREREWYIPQNGDFETCRQIGHQQNPPTRNQKATGWCQKLFQDENQAPPAACSSEPIPTTRQKCNEIRDSGGENVPLSCKLLPLFAGQLENPPEGNVTGGEGNCPAQNLGDFPIPLPGCAISAPPIPKINFPTIVVPDIHLPTFSLPPIFRVKLPNLIFEDLNIGEINLCNLDDCNAQFPYLSFQLPTLKIPQVNIPPVTLEIPGASPIDIQIEPINFPPLNFNIPQLFNLGSLVTPELKIPELPLPQPRIQFSFLGVNIDLLNLLLGLLKKPPPSFNYCVTESATTGVLDIVYPDKYFPWPAYPRPQELKFCKEARAWCQRQKGSIQEITAKATKIQEQVNSVFQREIQAKLDKVAVRLNQKITREIERELGKIKNEISQQLLRHLARYAPQNIIPPSAPVPGVWQVVGEIPCQGIPPLNVYLPPDLQNISIDPKKIDEFLQEEFGETWPTEITIQWPDNLKKFKLSCNESSCNSCENRGDTACKRLLGEGCPTFEAWGDYLECRLNYRTNNCKNECKSCLSYDLPPVPLCRLSYEKEFTKRLPGHQLSITAPRDLLSGLKNARECISKPPKGGNPCQVEAQEIQTNLNQIKRLAEEIKEASKKIGDLLY